ncbi:12702_t:CDS:2, partial [Funneliformis geosporum]
MKDILNEACGVCDNCLLNICDKSVWNEFSADIIRLLKIAKEILISEKIYEIVLLDITEVFCKLKRANEMGLSELSIVSFTENFSFKSVIIGLDNNTEEEAKHIK